MGDATYDGLTLIGLGVAVVLYFVFVHGDPLSAEALSGARPGRTPLFGTLLGIVSIVAGLLTLSGRDGELTDF